MMAHNFQFHHYNGREGEKRWVKIRWGSIWHCRQIVEHEKVSLYSLIYFALSVINLYNRTSTFTSRVIDVILSSNLCFHTHIFSFSFWISYVLFVAFALLLELSEMNEWVMPSLKVRETYKKSVLFAKLKGWLSRKSERASVNSYGTIKINVVENFYTITLE